MLSFLEDSDNYSPILQLIHGRLVHEATAVKVGQRHGKPVVLRVKAGEMWRKGQVFYLSENGVWLTEKVEPGFIEMVNVEW